METSSLKLVEKSSICTSMSEFWVNFFLASGSCSGACSEACFGGFGVSSCLESSAATGVTGSLFAVVGVSVDGISGDGVSMVGVSVVALSDAGVSVVGVSVPLSPSMMTVTSVR